VDPERAQRAVSFSLAADTYERHRPEYPEEAARWLTGEPPLDVVDLAAGTGKLTRVLVRLGHRVTAVEPLPEMLEVLREMVPEAAPVVGSAESMPLPDESADAVVAAQAFHWFDHQPALREIARVLRPGGSLGLIWNMRDESVDWLERLTGLIGGGHGDGPDVDEIVAESGLYAPVEVETWTWEQPITREGLRGLVESRSYCITLPAGERAEVLAAVDRLYEEVAGDGPLAMPYVTEGFRAVRR
jgi:SAM-dependent methyltransferase